MFRRECTARIVNAKIKGWTELHVYQRQAEDG